MLKQLKYFQSVVRLNSFSEAAEENFISQFAISGVFVRPSNGDRFVRSHASPETFPSDPYSILTER